MQIDLVQAFACPLRGGYKYEDCHQEKDRGDGLRDSVGFHHAEKRAAAEPDSDRAETRPQPAGETAFLRQDSPIFGEIGSVLREMFAVILCHFFARLVERPNASPPKTSAPR